MNRFIIWAGVLSLMLVPVLVAAFSPLLAWRDPIYIFAGFCGIFALAIFLLQPLLAAQIMPGLSPRASQRLHRLAGLVVVSAVLAHVIGLWITSPPDVVDALLFTSPTPFSGWGVVAMWAVFCAAGLLVVRRRLGLRLWRAVHSVLVALAVAGTIVHALLIEGTMGPVSKWILCLCVAAATSYVIFRKRAWRVLFERP
ncbi:MAG: ferric reductase-like transmembrane domain-containing protein [Pseudomonadota bacterium]